MKLKRKCLGMILKPFKKFDRFDSSWQIWHIVQFFYSKTVVNSILSIGKNLKLNEKRLDQRSYFSSKLHKSMSRYNKDTKILVALLVTLKMFLSAEINSKVIEAATRNCSLKKFLSKIFVKFARKYFSWSLFFEK